MRSGIRLISILLLGLGLRPVTPTRPAGEASGTAAAWQVLEPGLELAAFDAPEPSPLGDSLIRILRIDPRRFRLRLMNASAPGQGRPLTARQWCQRGELVAAINASMYQEDYRTSVSLMRTMGHVNNGHLSRDRAVLAFDPLHESLPEVQIIDRECQEVAELAPNYGSLVQSIRMLSCRGENVWKQQPKKSSAAAIGTDRGGRVLFIHVASPYTTHDLIEMLRKVPVDLEKAMYAEGGSEAQLYVRSGEWEFEFVGMGGAAGRAARPVPNVIGVGRR